MSGNEGWSAPGGTPDDRRHEQEPGIDPGPVSAAGPAGPPEGRPSRPRPRYGQYADDVDPRYGRYGTPPARPAEQGPGYGPDVAPPRQEGGHGRYGDHDRYGQYGQYGQYGAAGAVPTPRGFTGGRQPGIVPLRPLTVGEILDGGFRAIRANPRVMFGLSLLVLGVAAVIESAVVAVFLGDMLAVLETGMVPDSMESLGVGTSLAALATAFAVYVASILLTGLLIVSVSQSVLGRVVSVGDVWRQARPRLAALLGLTLLLALLALLGGVLLAVVAGLLAAAVIAALGESATVLAVLVVLAVVGVMVLAGAFLVVRLSLAAPALMLEHAGVGTALRRSWSLSAGQFWRIAGVLLLATVIVTVISYALMIVPSLIIGFTASTPDALLAGTVATTMLSVLISAVTTPFLAAVLALVYVDVRMRREGLDVELARAADAG